MEEILALQRQLAEAQSSSKAAKLSERNCIELVMKLQSLSLVDLVFTRTGKEYLTPSQLTREIQDEIFVRGGRVNVIDLPDALNVDLAHVEAAIPAVLDAATCETRVVNGEVVNEDYLASLAGEVDASLQESATGIDDIGSIASRTNLPVAVIRDCISKYLGSTIRATVDNSSGVLRSDASRARAVASARGALRAASTPTLLCDISERFSLPAGIVEGVVAELLSSNQLRGRLHGTGNRALFLPAVFENAARVSTLSDFASNGFLMTDRLRTLNIANPEDFIRENAADAVFLGEVVIGPSLLESLESLSVDAIENASWLDLGAALPPAFPTEHTSQVIALLDFVGKEITQASGKTAPGGPGKSGKGKGSSKRKGPTKSKDSVSGPDRKSSVKLDARIFDSQYLVSPALMTRCQVHLQTDADERAKRRAEKLSDMGSVVGGIASVSPAGLSNSEKDTSAPSKRGKTRRRKDKSTGGTGSDKNGVGDGGLSVPVEVPSTDELCRILVAHDDVRDAFSADYLGNTTAEDFEVLTVILEEGLCGKDGSALSSMYESAAAAAVEAMERERAEAKQRMEKDILAGLERAELYDTAARTLKATAGAPESSSMFTLNSTCRDTTVTMMEFIANNVGMVGIDRESSAESIDIIRNLNKRLPPQVATLARPLVSSVSGKHEETVDQFLAAYDASADALDLPPRRPLDKKRERALNSSLTEELVSSLAEASLTPMSAMRACVILLHARRTSGTVVALSPAQVPSVSEALETAQDWPEGSSAALLELREAVTVALRETGDVPIGEELRLIVQKFKDLVVLER